LVALVDAEETKLLTKLVENPAKFIRRLPWAEISNGENDGKGRLRKTSLNHQILRASTVRSPAICFVAYTNLLHSQRLRTVRA
jgi:hypothetical protein